ncbi:tRNA 2-thiouridine(34) synthase MnmA [Haploplasma modicum]|uniref:tRNA 2-thiouridine(34) synthase MnmA n=1 Tax=Haploplasma modicum TaxID=2150 RepID=UPI00047B43EE|nr:tRNA 2-thiouridine(34) synthase MnmA [Haploplasma modicum]
MKKNKKVILGLSGGVDSSVAAYLLQQQGYDVEAVFMRNWDSTLNSDLKGNPTRFNEICEQEIDFNDAKKVADKLGIKLHKIDFIKEYWDNVFTYFLDEYRKNRTPNPDILCNNEIKFKAFINHASKFDFDYIAMGHYANVKQTENGPILMRAKDLNKDQTYFLSQLETKQLEKVLFPLGNLNKEEVREIAQKLNLATATKKDSTGICFIGERNFSDFLSNYLPAKKGNMTRLDGTFVKEHYGLMNYTIGQRKGLGIGGSHDSLEAWYVVGKDLKTNTLFVEPDKNHPHLFSNKAIIKDIKWRGNKDISNLTAKFRYRQADINIKLEWLNDTEAVIYYDNVKAVTPGQACVFYQGDICLGSGFIDTVYHNDEIRKYS